MKLNENLRQNDLKYCISNFISVDEYVSKIDNDNITVAFFCNDDEIASELKDFIEKAFFIEIRDIEIADTITEDNKYILFVEFKRKEELAEYYKMADLFVLPTREDIWGLVINEAMAKGLPIITTDKCVAGLELIQNGMNGQIVKSDDISAIRDAVLYWLNQNEKARNRAGEKSLQEIKYYMQNVYTCT